MLKLPPTLTQASATVSLRDLNAALKAETTAVVVDASDLSRFDSAALAVLLALRRQALAQGKTLAIKDLPQGLGDLARLYGIAELLPTQTASPP